MNRKFLAHERRKSPIHEGTHSDSWAVIFQTGPLSVNLMAKKLKLSKGLVSMYMDILAREGVVKTFFPRVASTLFSNFHFFSNSDWRGNIYPG